MAKTKQDSVPKLETITAKFQAASVASDGGRVSLITVDSPDASGINDNTIKGGLQFISEDEATVGFFEAGAEYTVEIKKVVTK